MLFIRDECYSDKIINLKISSQLNKQEIKELNNKEREKDFYNTQKRICFESISRKKKNLKIQDILNLIKILKFLKVIIIIQ